MSGMRPFGEICCEAEREVLGKSYSNYYFEHTSFNGDSLDRDVYLIVGRRGCGKTSLGEFFKFQSDLPNAHCIDVDEPRLYNAVLHRVIGTLGHASEVAITLIVDVWNYAIWSLIFKEYRELDPRIERATFSGAGEASGAALIKALISNLEQKRETAGEALDDQLDATLRSPVFEAARQAVLEITARQPIIVAIDSMEHFSIRDDAVMWATAALIQCASEFNTRYARRGVHLKVFLTDEVFPHLQENVVTNTAKHVRNPLFLHWRPKDLVRLVCWRFYKYLSDTPHHTALPKSVDWDDFHDVESKMWTPFFGVTLRNRNHVTENTLPYVLRHTQMRPRQLIILCNEIARLAERNREFPRFSSEVLIQAVRQSEGSLADEVINAYSRIHPEAGKIVAALSGVPMIFKGQLLDRVAKRTSSHWKVSEYSLDQFRQIVAEMGIVGRQRGGKDDRTGILEADFEFAMEDRLYIHEKDDCVIHPMFYRKLNTEPIGNLCIYPFPDRPEYSQLRTERRSVPLARSR
jgi:hypothetical protein